MRPPCGLIIKNARLRELIDEGDLVRAQPRQAGGLPKDSSCGVLIKTAAPLPNGGA